MSVICVICVIPPWPGAAALFGHHSQASNKPVMVAICNLRTRGGKGFKLGGTYSTLKEKKLNLSIHIFLTNLNTVSFEKLSKNISQPIKW